MADGPTFYPVILARGECAFDRMRTMYKDYDLPFEDDLINYARTGFVKVSPTAMALFKPARDEQGNYWFVRGACGNLMELLTMMPCWLPRIKWMRRNKGKIREWRTERLYKLAIHLNEKGLKSWVAQAEA